jgi:hypothetical protein
MTARSGDTYLRTGKVFFGFVRMGRKAKQSLMLATAATCLIVGAACAQEPTAAPSSTRPNILVIFGDDIG